MLELEQFFEGRLSVTKKTERVSIPAGIIPGSNLLTRGSIPFFDYTWRQMGDHPLPGIFPATFSLSLKQDKGKTIQLAAALDL